MDFLPVVARREPELLDPAEIAVVEEICVELRQPPRRIHAAADGNVGRRQGVSPGYRVHVAAANRELRARVWPR